MIALPTARGWLILAMTLGAAGVALVNVGLATALAASAFAAFLLAAFVIAQCSVYGIRVERGGNGDGVCGGELILPLTVTNRTILFRQATVLAERCEFAPGGVLHTAVPPLSPRESLRLARSLITEKRGCFELGTVRLSGGDPAGLFRRTKRFRLPGEVVIYPRVVRLESIQLHPAGAHTLGTDGRPLGRSGQGQEFFGLRPYRPGDEIRFIHWRGTASKQRLMIREFEANTVDQVVILLDTCATLVGNDPRESNLEFLISMAASLAAFLKEISCRVLFMAADGRTGEPVRLFGDSAGLYPRLRRLLTVIEPGRVPFSFLLQEAAEEIPAGSLVYALCLGEEKAAAELLELLFDCNCRIHWFLAPKGNFPPIQADEPRIVYERRRQELPPGAVRPRELFFTTRMAEVLEK